MWQFNGEVRPDFAIPPGPGQESVWDYPRPPRAVTCKRSVEVSIDDGRLLTESRGSIRVLETASPPSYYLPPTAVDVSQLVELPMQSYCEWKGPASYWGLPGGTEAVAWCYREPPRRFTGLRAYVSFYPGRVICLVDGERVSAQPGRFYGGWVTTDIVGPFKGLPGTEHW